MWNLIGDLVIVYCAAASWELGRLGDVGGTWFDKLTFCKHTLEMVMEILGHPDYLRVLNAVRERMDCDSTRSRRR